MAHKVAVYRADLLHISETFIRDQASALTQWAPTLVGRREVPGGLATPKVDRVIVPESNLRTLRTLRYWAWRPDPALVRYLRSQDFSLVHAHFGTDAIDIWPSVKAAGLPLLVTLHGYDINIHRWWWEQGHGGLRRRVYPARLLKMAQDPSVRFIAVSDFVKRRAMDYGIPENKITVCYIGVDIRRFRPGPIKLTNRRKLVLFVGRMVENKSPLFLAQAFQEVQKKIPEAEMTMIGTGPLLNDVELFAKRHNLNIKFLGQQTQDQIIMELQQSRVLCLPSSSALNGASEAFGLVLLEAQACGVPVVSSAEGGAYEGLLHGRTGYRFDELNLAQCASAITSILNDENKSIEMSLESRLFAENSFDIKILTRKLEQSYAITRLALAGVE